MEIDENQHKDYDITCNNKRLCELYQDFGKVPIIFIRFNPDSYMDSTGTRVTSCFGYNTQGICTIKKCKVKEFDDRIRILLFTIQRYAHGFCTERSITQLHLFYDEFLDRDCDVM